MADDPKPKSREAPAPWHEHALDVVVDGGPAQQVVIKSRQSGLTEAMLHDAARDILLAREKPHS